MEKMLKGQHKQRKYWPEMSRNIYDDKVQRQFHFVFYTIFLNVIKFSFIYPCHYFKLVLNKTSFESIIFYHNILVYQSIRII